MVDSPNQQMDRMGGEEPAPREESTRIWRLTLTAIGVLLLIAILWIAFGIGDDEEEEAPGEPLRQGARSRVVLAQVTADSTRVPVVATSGARGPATSASIVAS